MGWRDLGNYLQLQNIDTTVTDALVLNFMLVSISNKCIWSIQAITLYRVIHTDQIVYQYSK